MVVSLGNYQTEFAIATFHSPRDTFAREKYSGGEIESGDMLPLISWGTMRVSVGLCRRFGSRLGGGAPDTVNERTA